MLWVQNHDNCLLFFITHPAPKMHLYIQYLVIGYSEHFVLQNNKIHNLLYQDCFECRLVHILLVILTVEICY